MKRDAAASSRAAPGVHPAKARPIRGDVTIFTEPLYNSRVCELGGNRFSCVGRFEPSLIQLLSVSLGEQVMRDGFPHAVAVGLGLVVAFGLAFFTIVAFGGFP